MAGRVARHEIDPTRAYCDRTAICVSTVNSLDLAYELVGLGDLTRARGPCQSRVLFRQGGGLFPRNLNDNCPASRDAAEALDTLGDLAQQHGDYAKAEEYFRLALKVWQTVTPGDPSVARKLHSLAFVLRRHGQLDGAATLLHDSLETVEKQIKRLGDDEEFPFLVSRALPWLLY